MERTLYGFNYDYIRHRGTRLLLSGTTPLRHDAMQRIELRMLEENDIPGLLRLESEEIDMEVKLRYDITGKKMLSQWMMTGRFTLPAYYRFLLRCTDTIDDSKTYMLREEGYWLHENFMFVGNDSVDQLELVYVPVQLPDGLPKVREQFKQLALRLSACIDHIEGNGFSALLSMLHRDRFEFYELKTLLSNLMSPEPGLPDRTAHSAAGERYVEHLEPLHKDVAEPPHRNEETMKGAGPLPEWIASRPVNDEMKSMDDADDDLLKSGNEVHSTNQHEAAAVPPMSARQQMLIGAAAGAGLLLLWSFFPDDAPEGAFSVWTGLTIAVLDVVFVWIRLRPNLLRSSQWRAISASYKTMEEREMTGLTGYLPTMQKNGAKPAAPSAFTEYSAAPSVSEQRSFINQPLLRAKSESTTILQPPDATVCLKPEAGGLTNDLNADRETKIRPILELLSGGKTEQINIAGERLVIGRERGVADYAVHDAGVSKLHLEITCEQHSYYAKDLGSRNGTYWNDELMVPYKLYPLSDGDRLTVIQTKFIFRRQAVNRSD